MQKITYLDKKLLATAKSVDWKLIIETIDLQLQLINVNGHRRFQLGKTQHEQAVTRYNASSYARPVKISMERDLSGSEEGGPRKPSVKPAKSMAKMAA